MAISRDDTHMHVPRVTYQKFHALLPGSLQPDSRFFYDTCVRYNVDPLFVLAMFNHESSMGQEGWATRTYSWGNTRVPNFGPTPRGFYEQDNGTFHEWRPGPYPPRILVAFYSWRDGLESTVARLSQANYPVNCGYRQRTIGEIFEHPCKAVWAPAGDMNNPAGYLNSVLTFMNTHADIGGTVSGNPYAKLTTYQGFLADNAVNNPNVVMYGGSPSYITVHETGNMNPGATAAMHYNFVMNGGGKYNVSFHAVVDEFASYQMMPWNKAAYHASDGGGSGNYDSIAIETVQIGNWEATLRRLAKLIADLRREFGLGNDKVKQHNYWAPDGKNCPEYLRAGRNPTTGNVSVNWNGLLYMVETEFQGGTDVDFPTEKVTQRINSRGEMELIINYGGQWTEVDGNVVVDAGVTGFNKDGVKYGRSYQAANGGFQNFNILGKKGE